MRTLAVLVTLVLALGSCSDSSESSPPDSIDTTISTQDGATSSSTADTSSPDRTEAPNQTTSTVVPDETSTPSSTTEPVVTAPTTTETPLGLVLTDAGVGPLKFGARLDAAVEFLAGALGPATDDSGWGSSFSGFGTCPGTEVRGVSFGPLTVLFGDPEGVREFYAWTYSAFGTADNFGLETTKGVGVGDSTESVLDAYPGTVVDPGDGPFAPSARIDEVYVTFDDSGTVQFLGGGTLCGE
jgi:hypothetical protein